MGSVALSAVVAATSALLTGRFLLELAWGDALLQAGLFGISFAVLGVVHLYFPLWNQRALAGRKAEIARFDEGFGGPED
jgi:hypothetical protein